MRSATRNAARSDQARTDWVTRRRVPGALDVTRTVQPELMTPGRKRTLTRPFGLGIRPSDLPDGDGAAPGFPPRRRSVRTAHTVPLIVREAAKPALSSTSGRGGAAGPPTPHNPPPHTTGPGAPARPDPYN
jgi:hypothetical protein